MGMYCSKPHLRISKQLVHNKLQELGVTAIKMYFSFLFVYFFSIVEQTILGYWIFLGHCRARIWKMYSVSQSQAAEGRTGRISESLLSVLLSLHGSRDDSGSQPVCSILRTLTEMYWQSLKRLSWNLVKVCMLPRGCMWFSDMSKLQFSQTLIDDITTVCQ